MVQLQYTTSSLSAARKRGRCRVERRTMTPMAKLLRQAPALFRRALDHTRDVNEAYFLVHGVIATAVGQMRLGDQNSDTALACALEKRLIHTAGAPGSA